MAPPYRSITHGFITATTTRDHCNEDAKHMNQQHPYSRKRKKTANDEQKDANGIVQLHLLSRVL